MVALYIHDVIDMYRFAVDVCRAVGGSFDDKAVGAESVDDGVLVNQSCHQVGSGYHGA